MVALLNFSLTAGIVTQVWGEMEMSDFANTLWLTLRTHCPHSSMDGLSKSFAEFAPLANDDFASSQVAIKEILKLSLPGPGTCYCTKRSINNSCRSALMPFNSSVKPIHNWLCLLLGSSANKLETLTQHTLLSHFNMMWETCFALEKNTCLTFIPVWSSRN